MIKSTFNRFWSSGKCNSNYEKNLSGIWGRKDFIYKHAKNGNIDQSIVKLTSKLSLLPADSSLANLSDIISKTDILKKRYILKNVVEKIKEIHDFDYIFIDVPPTINSDFTNNAVYASDYILMVFQTQQSAYESSLSFVNF